MSLADDMEEGRADSSISAAKLESDEMRTGEPEDKVDSSIPKRSSRGSLGFIRQWSTQWRGEDGEPQRPPSGVRYRRTSSSATTDKAYERQPSRRSAAELARSVSISPATYHNDLKQDIKWSVNSNLILAAFVVVFGSSFQFGFNIGVLNPQDAHIKSFIGSVLESRWKEKPSQETITNLWSLTTALFIPGGLIGSLLGGWMADRFGRKMTLIFSHLFVLVGAPLASACVVAQSPEMLMISRILFGLNAGLGNCAAPMFLSEITPFSIRGAFSTVHQLFVTIGILMSSIFGLPQLLGNKSQWQYLFALELIPAITAIVAIPFLKETPRFLLLIRNQRKEAQKALVFYRKTEDIHAELEEIDTEQKATNLNTANKPFTWKQLITTTNLRRPLVIAVMLQIMQQFSGINAVFFYSAGIFSAAGVPLEHVPYAILGTNTVNVLMTVITVPLIDKIGRRPLLLIPMLVMAFDLIILIVCLKLQPSYSWLGIASVISIIIYVIGFAVGLGPIPMMLAAELFRQEPRPKAMALAGIVNWIGTFVIAMAFEPIKDAIGYFVFLIFCILLFIFTVFTYLCVPETKNLTFEEIANRYAPGKLMEVDECDNVQPQSEHLAAVVNFDLESTSPMIEKPSNDPKAADDVPRSEFATFDTRL